MENFDNSLRQSILAGLMNGAFDGDSENIPKLIRNEKEKQKKVLGYICDNLEKSISIKISVAFLTTSGVAVIQNSLKKFLKNNHPISATIIVSDYLHFTQPAALKKLLNFEQVDLRLIRENNFHGKGYLFEKENKFDLLIGSSNLTASALTENEEINIGISASKESRLIGEFQMAFQEYLDKSEIITSSTLSEYEEAYNLHSRFGVSRKRQAQTVNEADKAFNNEGLIVEDEKFSSLTDLKPNLLQIEATKKLGELRRNGANKSLVISATGTGKTVLAALDAKAFQAKRVLFVVHRFNIASKALETFKTIFGNSRTYGMYSGSVNEIDKEFLFSTVQTINTDRHINKFKPNHFDYIIIDETHRAGAKTYQRVLDYFEPSFFLGMTATPERSDGYDIFALFEHNIGCEIRLHRALDENLLCPFHYFGISDLIVDGQEIDELSNFNELASTNRVNHIISAIKEYGTDTEIVRGLIFCSRIEEAETLSEKFNQRGFKTIALSGKNSEVEREHAMARLETDENNKLDYIFTVDIFNEGIDIPSLNQVIMLRPTQSPIVFVQQLGRGLRKAGGKEYLTIIDFIGNYKNNYMVPIALYGDKSFNKDNLRKLISSGSSILPGASTVNFDEISKAKIFASINSANLQTRKALIEDYRQQKFRIGRIPMMMDFFENESRDALQYVSYSRSFYNFAITEENEQDLPRLATAGSLLLEHLSKYVNDGIRGLDSFIIIKLIQNNKIEIKTLIDEFEEVSNHSVVIKDVYSAVNSINLLFHQERLENTFEPIGQAHNYQIAKIDERIIQNGETLSSYLSDNVFRTYLLDSSTYSVNIYLQKLTGKDYVKGFVRYQKYTRIDVLRILGWSEHPVPLQNVGGYKVSKDETNCPIFVTYHKKANITDTTKYEDEFLSPTLFSWMSRSNRTLNSNEVVSIISQKSNNIRLPLFIKKSDDEGQSHYYVGELTLVEGSPEVQYMPAGDGKQVSVVNMKFNIDKSVDSDLYKFLTRG